MTNTPNTDAELVPVKCTKTPEDFEREVTIDTLIERLERIERENPLHEKARAGVRGSQCGCPIAAFMEHLGYTLPRVGVPGASWEIAEEPEKRTEIRIHPCLAAFATAVDASGDPYTTISVGVALRLARKIAEARA